MADEAKPLSRSEREAQIKDKAGLVIVFMALFLAGNTYLANNFSSTAQTNLLKASNTYGFYQSKSIKQSIAEGQLEDAKDKKDKERIAKLEAKIARYESDPEKGEGKKELLEKAKSVFMQHSQEMISLQERLNSEVRGLEQDEINHDYLGFIEEFQQVYNAKLRDLNNQIDDEIIPQINRKIQYLEDRV